MAKVERCKNAIPNWIRGKLGAWPKPVADIEEGSRPLLPRQRAERSPRIIKILASWWRSDRDHLLARREPAFPAFVDGALIGPAVILGKDEQLIDASEGREGRNGPGVAYRPCRPMARDGPSI
jgi:hypothetical protein